MATSTMGFFRQGIFRARHGIQVQMPESNTDTTANVVVAQVYQSIIPLKGMLAGSSLWDTLPDFVEQYWREIDANVETE